MMGYISLVVLQYGTVYKIRNYLNDVYVMIQRKKEARERGGGSKKQRGG